MNDDSIAYSAAANPTPNPDAMPVFYQCTVKGPNVTTITSMDSPETFNGALLAVGFVSSTDFRIEGSAVMIAPAIALTAKHVIEPHMKSIEASKLVPMLTAFGGFGTLQLWDIKEITVIGETDLALLALAPRFDIPPDNSFTTVAMTTRMPKVGERVEIYGYRASDEEFTLIDGTSCTAAGSFYLSPGLVTAVYPDQRDSAMLRWPCFEVNCPALGGMSGGPAFDESGRLIGILTSSLGSLEDLTGPSYVSFLWHALATKINSAWPKNFIPAKTSIREMEARMRTIEREEAMQINGDSWTLARWS